MCTPSAHELFSTKSSTVQRCAPLFTLFKCQYFGVWKTFIIFATLFASSDGSNKKPFLAAPNPQMEKQRQQDLIRALFAKYRKWEIDLRRCSTYNILNIHHSRKYKKNMPIIILT